VIRRRVAGYGFFEELTVLNHGTEPIRPEIAMTVGADFADLFEVKDATIAKPGRTFSRIEDGMLVLGYKRGGYIRETWVRPHDEAAEVAEDRISFAPTIAPQGSWSTWIEVVTAVDGTPTGHERTRYRPGDESRPTASSRTDLGTHPAVSELLAVAPKLETDREPLKLTYARSLVDLAALRFYPREDSQVAVPAVGLPWFQTLFGRDSLITSYQALHIVPGWPRVRSTCSLRYRAGAPTTSETKSRGRSCTSSGSAS
jgi:glycogen debranching enzyme